MLCDSVRVKRASYITVVCWGDYCENCLVAKGVVHVKSN